MTSTLCGGFVWWWFGKWRSVLWWWQFRGRLAWEPRLGGLVDLVEFEDGVTNVGAALFKIAEAFSRGAFFFSTSVDLKTKGAGGGGAGREMMDSNKSLPAILTPKHFFGCFCDLFWQIRFFLYLFFRQVFGTQMWLSDLYDHICYQGNNLFGGEIKCVVGGWWWSLFYNGGIRNLILDYMLLKSLILVCRTASVIGDMRPPAVCTFWVFLFLFGQFLCEWASSYTTHFWFLVQFCALCPKPWHLKHCWIEGVILNSSTLKIMPVCWHINITEISASACFWSSHFIFMKGRSLPVLFDFILSASAWVILLKSSSSLKSSSVMLLDTPLKTFSFFPFPFLRLQSGIFFSLKSLKFKNLRGQRRRDCR